MNTKDTSQFCEYLKYSIYYCFETKISFFIITFIEILDILTNLIDQIVRIFYYNETFSSEDSTLSRHLLKVSPYNYFFKYLSDSDKIGEYISINLYLIIVYFVFIINLIIFFLFLPKGDFYNISNIEGNLFYKINVNFYDYVFHRPLSIYGFDLFTREIIKLLFFKEYKITEYILLLIFFLVLISIFMWHIRYVKRVNVWVNFIFSNCSLKYYPFDYFFSCKYDIVLLAIKLILTINKNYEFYNDNKVDYITLFNIFLLLIIFYGYSIYLIYIFFFSHKCLYIFDNFNNGFRTYNIMLLFQLIPIRILLHSKSDYKIFYSFFVFFAIFDLYVIIYSFSDFLFNKGIKCQNYLAVGYYIESNKIDLNSFITQWIINHTAVCIINECPICMELGKNEIIIPKEDIEDKKNKTITKDDIVNKKSHGNQNKLTESSLNAINKIFSPYTFNLKLITLAEEFKFRLDYEDTVRFDFLYLTGLFLSNKNIDFLLYSELCLLMCKYQANKSIFVSLRLVYNITRKAGQDKIKNFDLVKKNDDLRQSLITFIQDYETFISYSSKSPENYLAMSKKFKDFKDAVKNLHTIFKKNLERNYQLIIMRYAYDTLLHQSFKNEQTFDFSGYIEFLSDRFEKDKIILIKYLIDKDSFTIIKCSKDFIKYEGNNLENIFPDFLKISAIEKLRGQLKNIEQKDFNQVFEYVIKSTNDNNKDSFIEAFRIEFFIYPTYNINEIFIFAKKYIIGYTDYIIYEVKKDSKDYIFSFSYKIYKYFGITPEMISILRKIGVFIESDKILTQKDRNNKSLFILKYSHYFPFYEKLLKYDALMDLPDYPKIIEKAKEIKNMAKEEKEVSFIITLKGEYTYSGGALNLYSVREQLKKNEKHRKNSIKAREDDEDSEDVSYELSGERENGYNNQNINAATADIASQMSSSSYKDSGHGPSGAKGKQNDKNYERIKSLNTIYRFTIIILIFGIFLIILSAIFLVLLVKENMYFRNVFELFQTYKKFKRGIESSPLSLLSNYRYIQSFNDTTNEVISSINVYEDYSNNIKKDFNNSMQKIPGIYRFIQQEISVKYASVIDSFNGYLNTLFQIENDASHRVQNIIVFSYSLQKEEKITLHKSYINFISICREYNNFVSNLLLNNIYLKQNISIFHKASIDSLIIYVDTPFNFEFTSIIKNMLLLIFTYPSLHIGLTESSYFIQQEFHSSKKIMENLLIIFFILLTILHILLIIICASFFIIYLKLLKININSTNKLFMDKKYIKFQSKRLELIKIINTLYSVNPIILFDKIKNLEDDYKKKAYQEKKPKNTEFKSILYAENNIDKTPNDEKSISSSISKNNEKLNSLKKIISGSNENKKMNMDANNNEKEENKNNINEEDDENSPMLMKNYTLSPSLFHKIINSYKLILIYLFGSYFLYCIIFFIYVMLGLGRLTHAISYCEINSKIDELVYDNLNSLVYLYLTNSTTKDYNRIIYGNSTHDYLENAINSLYSSIQEKENIEYSYKYLFPPLNEIISLNCSEKDFIKDEEFIEACNILNISYDTFVESLCEVFPVAKTNSDINILNEILYMTEGFYRVFKTGEFAEIFINYIQDPVLCQCFTLILTFNKMIRAYFNDVIFPEQVYKIFDYFTGLIVAYLVMSVLFEIVFFVVLNVAILQKIKYSNELLLDFIDSLKF